MKKPTVSLEELTFSSNQVVSLNKEEKIILVGPNNSGKSQVLRDIIGVSKEGSRHRPVAIKNIKLAKSSGSSELISFLELEAIFDNGRYEYKNWSIRENFVKMWDDPYLTNGLADGFIKNIDANDRLSICEQQLSIADGEQKSKPQHLIYDSEALMEKVSKLFRNAFGKDLMINFRGGKVIPIHVGDKPPVYLKNKVGDEYVKYVKNNPLLNKQGDGMKSYAGIIFETIASDMDITLLDEPEAFLHPPQMRRLGEMLASEVSGQLIVATHSSDILRGFLEGTRGSIRILRLRREGAQNFVAEAESKVIQELWERPTLRYSNALESIFHEQAILCEDDSDCRLINAVADYLEATDSTPWMDTAYIPTGGKHGIPKIASVLRKVGVPVKAVFDIDLLSDAALTKETVEAFGGDWKTIQPYWMRVDAAIRGGNKPKSNDEIKVEIRVIIDEAAPDELPRSSILEAMKQGKSWNIVKRFGSVVIPNGDAQRDFACLQSNLESIGIYIISVGEIENFCKELGSHGPKFVTKLLSELSLEDVRLTELRNFVSRIHKGPYGPL